jgi:hypothetical protein
MTEAQHRGFLLNDQGGQTIPWAKGSSNSVCASGGGNETTQPMGHDGDEATDGVDHARQSQSHWCFVYPEWRVRVCRDIFWI